jgi:predicted ATPase
MIIREFRVENYKSLHAITVLPQPLTVVIGANGSGKSNLADCFDFVSEVYRHGLEVAVARKGGFETIAHRKVRRTKLAIAISTVAELDKQDLQRWSSPKLDRIRFTHRFAFKTKGQTIAADFEVESEYILTEVHVDGRWAEHALVQRVGNSIKVEINKPIEKRISRLAIARMLTAEVLDFFSRQKGFLSSTELFAVAVGRLTSSLRFLGNAMGGIRVFQISPNVSREFGIPTPGPELNRYGGNLPAVVDLLKKKNPVEWRHIMQLMKRILPGLTSIDVRFAYARTYGLFFSEEGVGRPWSAAEVSDGTIQALALLVAMYDPRSSLLIIEEPENSIHPWIIRNILEACREVTPRKQVMFTTHSPVVLNSVRPEEVLVIWREAGESKIRPLIELDPDVVNLWSSGKVLNFDFIDSGAVEQALPPPPILNLTIDKTGSK